MTTEAKQIPVDVTTLIAHYRQQLADANERAIVSAATAETLAKAYEAKEAELAAAKARIAEIEAA